MRKHQGPRPSRSTYPQVSFGGAFLPYSLPPRACCSCHSCMFMRLNQGARPELYPERASTCYTRTNPFGQLRFHLFWLLELFGLLPNDCSTLLSFPFAFSDFNCAPFIAVTEAACESLAGWVIFPESSEGIAGTD
jgi:hypothetical protein